MQFLRIHMIFSLLYFFYFNLELGLQALIVTSAVLALLHLSSVIYKYKYMLEHKVYLSNHNNIYHINPTKFPLTLKAPIMTAADDIHKYFFIVFQRA